jgi:hypothetical protein
MRTDCIVELSKLKIFELNTLVQKETSDHVEGKPPPSDTFATPPAGWIPIFRGLRPAGWIPILIRLAFKPYGQPYR